MRIYGRNVLAGLALLPLLPGCGSDSSPSGSAPAAKKITQASKPGDMLVSALAVVPTVTVPVQVKFDLRTRPDVGTPVEIDLVLVPTSAVLDRLSGKVTAGEGLEVVDGADISAVERPGEGVQIHHALKVLPKRAGIFTFNAVVTVDIAGQMTTQTYSMPLIAGTGMPDLPAKSGPGASAAGAAVATAAHTASAALPPRAGPAAPTPATPTH